MQAQHYLEVQQCLGPTNKLSSSVETKVWHCRETDLPRVSNHLINLAQIQRLIHLPQRQRLTSLTKVQCLIDRTQIYRLSKLQW